MTDPTPRPHPDARHEAGLRDLLDDARRARAQAERTLAQAADLIARRRRASRKPARAPADSQPPGG